MRVELPIELIPHHFIRRPTEVEANVIRGFLDARDISGSLVYEAIPSNSPGSFSRSATPNDWRYFVVEMGPDYHGAINDGIIEVEKAAQLTDMPIEFGLWLNDEKVGLYSDTELHRLDIIRGRAFFPSTGGDPVVVDQVFVEELRGLHAKMKLVSPAHPEIQRAIDSLYQLRVIDHGTPLRILGLFATLESLITHNPKGTDDSLGRQIASKLKLLGKRFSRPLDYTPFGGMSTEKAWAKLYDCRSRIAHGGKLEFSGDLQALGNIWIVEHFVMQATRRVMQQALAEPDLIMDLRDC